MKRVILVFSAIAMVAIAQAQIGVASTYKPKKAFFEAEAPSGIQFGIKAGLNMNKFGGDDASIGEVDPEFLAGIGGGFLVNLPVGGMFAVQPEVLFSMGGSKYEESGEELKYRLNYLNVPVMFQYRTSGFYAETGPQIGFLMSAEAKFGDEDGEDIKDQFKSINFNWGLGLGYRMMSGFGIGARYNFGLANIIDEEDVSVTEGGFHVGLFYLFGGDKK